MAGVEEGVSVREPGSEGFGGRGKGVFDELTGAGVLGARGDGRLRRQWGHVWVWRGEAGGAGWEWPDMGRALWQIEALWKATSASCRPAAAL